MTESGPDGTPVGAVLIALLTGLYGLMWILSGLLASGHADVRAAFAPFVGLAIVAVAVGLWLRSSVAWFLTVALYACGTVWTITEVLSGASDRLTAVVVGLVVVGYLIARRDQFGETDSAGIESTR